MTSDPAVILALASVATAFITAVGAVLVAMVNNRRERGGAAGAGIEATLRERIVLRDEWLMEAHRETQGLRAALDAALQDLEESTVQLQALKDEPRDTRTARGDST